VPVSRQASHPFRRLAPSLQRCRTSPTRRRCIHCDAVAIARPKPPATAFGGTGAAAASFFALVSLRQRVSASWLDENHLDPKLLAGQKHLVSVPSLCFCFEFPVLALLQGDRHLVGQQQASGFDEPP
jgi:hypothetical protein